VTIGANERDDLTAVLEKWWPTVRDLPVAQQAGAYQRLVADLPERQRSIVAECLAEIAGHGHPLFKHLAEHPARVVRFRGKYYPVPSTAVAPPRTRQNNVEGASLTAALAFLLPLAATLIAFIALGARSYPGLLIGLAGLAASPVFAAKRIAEGADRTFVVTWLATVAVCALAIFLVVGAIGASWGTSLE
jgi:hypothetical protein